MSYKIISRLLLSCLIAGSISCSKTVDNTGTCHDGRKNQGEQGIDCGGPCPQVCESCADGIMNQDETAVDCGGSCDPCYPSLRSLLNGTQWNSSSRGAMSNGPGALRVFGTGSGQSIALYYSGPFVIGITNLGQNFRAEFSNGQGQVYQSRHSGKISFTTFDTLSRKISGSFQFIATDTLTNNSVFVSSGVFTELSY